MSGRVTGWSWWDGWIGLAAGRGQPSGRRDVSALEPGGREHGKPDDGGQPEGEQGARLVGAVVMSRCGHG